jgi:hypothetical protein
MLRLLFWICALAAGFYVAVTVPLGKRTLAEHVRRIWSTPEAQDFRDDLKVQKERASRELHRRLHEVEERLADGGAEPPARSEHLPANAAR